MDQKYIDNLESTVQKMLTPLKDLPFSVIIKSLSGFSVLPFVQEKNIIALFEKAFDKASYEINRNGIKSARPNEVGNYIEPFVKNALNTVGFQAITPISQNIGKKPSGYPDIEVYYNNQYFYLEVKTYNIKNINTTQRAFYFSPSRNFKVTKNAPHLLISLPNE